MIEKNICMNAFMNETKEALGNARASASGRNAIKN